MHNWSVDVKKLKKYPEKYALWRLEQLINYGLDEEKLDKKEVKRLWPKIKDDLDPDRRKAIEFFIWGKKWHKEAGLLPDRSNFWNWYFKHRTSSKSSI